ncbi:MAG: hypothetical protein UU47_C0001G0003 [candidate division TM6 bacterium GW2011_GWE2_41_16]|nr:MAG: hypothetical protein UU47_C0001G0003 [candidate division TM6 bacterium GW2011_GWE2_41_16]
MITVQQTDRFMKVNRAQVRADLEMLLEHEGYAGYDIGVRFVSERMIQKYNKTFRAKDASTDVLSFPYHDTLKPGHRIEVVMDEDKNLGDIIISLAYVQRWCDEHDYDLDQRVKELLVHGFCHLLGYDHLTDDEYEIMHAYELKLIDLLN